MQINQTDLALAVSKPGCAFFRLTHKPTGEYVTVDLYEPQRACEEAAAQLAERLECEADFVGALYARLVGLMGGIMRERTTV